MVHIGTAMVVDQIRDVTPFGDRAIPLQHSVLVVRSDDQDSEFLDLICEFLDIGVEHASGSDDLGPMLYGLRPMAVIADVDGDPQDGFHVMKVVASYDPALPVLLLSSKEPAILGAVDAVQEVWGLTSVATVPDTGRIGTLVDFICHAARGSGMSRLMRL